MGEYSQRAYDKFCAWSGKVLVSLLFKVDRIVRVVSWV